ncbi:uncharacterized protein TrAtP1_012738 [Trichoderma atroviride]|uniref:uncharacterized protein n=1 Tax=Hypocrea atroviridis TaxID=63577 RepID=UPI003330446D|nr:hypothetical protein TrAtP1_012738 [Trichoderma atroviride]
MPLRESPGRPGATSTRYAPSIAPCQQPPKALSHCITSPSATYALRIYLIPAVSLKQKHRLSVLGSRLPLHRPPILVTQISLRPLLL